MYILKIPICHLQQFAFCYPVDAMPIFNDTANSKKTYHQNRSRVLREMLDSRGWRKAEADETATFGMWDSYQTTPRQSRFRAFERRHVNKIDDKRGLFKDLQQAGLRKLMPETYLTYEQFCAEATTAPDILWYIKLTYSTAGKGVFCFSDKDAMGKKIKELNTQYYVIQRGIDEQLLFDGCKTTLRTYVLLLDDLSTYVYRESLVSVGSVPYDPRSTERTVQIQHDQIAPYSSDDFAFYDLAWPKIKKSVAQTMKSFQPHLHECVEPGRYHLFGFDFLCDTKYQPYMIEINSWPNMGYSDTIPGSKDRERSIKLRMLLDLVQMVFSRGRARNKDGPGRFDKVLKAPAKHKKEPAVKKIKRK